MNIFAKIAGRAIRVQAPQPQEVASIRLRFEEICRNHSGVPASFEIKDNTKLGKGLGLDSLDLIEVAMLAEDEFGITITDREVDSCDSETFGGMIRLIEGKLGC